MATWKLRTRDCSWQEESQSFKACPLPLSLGQVPEFTVEQWWAQNFLCLNSSYRPVIEEVCFLCTNPSAGTKLHMSVRDVWVWHGRAGIAKWGGVGVTWSWLDHIFPIFSRLRWTGNKQALFIKRWYYLCTQQLQHWSLASQWEIYENLEENCSCGEQAQRREIV